MLCIGTLLYSADTADDVRFALGSDACVCSKRSSATLLSSSSSKSKRSPKPLSANLFAIGSQQQSKHSICQNSMKILIFVNLGARDWSFRNWLVWTKIYLSTSDRAYLIVLQIEPHWLMQFAYFFIRFGFRTQFGSPSPSPLSLNVQQSLSGIQHHHL